MVCDVCGQEGARLRRVTRSYGKGATILVIENVPVVSCPHYPGELGQPNTAYFL